MPARSSSNVRPNRAPKTSPRIDKLLVSGAGVLQIVLGNEILPVAVAPLVAVLKVVAVVSLVVVVIAVVATVVLEIGLLVAIVVVVVVVEEEDIVVIVVV